MIYQIIMNPTTGGRNPYESASVHNWVSSLLARTCIYKVSGCGENMIGTWKEEEVVVVVPGPFHGGKGQADQGEIHWWCKPCPPL